VRSNIEIGAIPSWDHFRDTLSKKSPIVCSNIEIGEPNNSFSFPTPILRQSQDVRSNIEIGAISSWDHLHDALCDDIHSQQKSCEAQDQLFNNQELEFVHSDDQVFSINPDWFDGLI